MRMETKIQVTIGVRKHGQSPEFAIWGFRKKNKYGDTFIASLMGIGHGDNRDYLRDLVGPYFHPVLHILDPYTTRKNDQADGEFLYVQSSVDWSAFAPIVFPIIGHFFVEEVIFALKSGLSQPIVVDIDLGDYVVKVAKKDKEQAKTTTTVAVEMTVASEQFKVTLDKNGGDIRIQNREQQALTFSIPRNKLDELIDVLQQVRDVHVPNVDRYGEE